MGCRSTPCLAMFGQFRPTLSCALSLERMPVHGLGYWLLHSTVCYCLGACSTLLQRRFTPSYPSRAWSAAQRVSMTATIAVTKHRLPCPSLTASMSECSCGASAPCLTKARNWSCNCCAWFHPCVPASGQRHATYKCNNTSSCANLQQPLQCCSQTQKKKLRQYTGRSATA